MNDMQANLERFEAFVNPSGGGSSSEEALGSFADQYTGDVKLRWQGADWPWGGNMDGRDKLLACLHVSSKIFSDGPNFWESRFWILDDEWLLWWWRSRGMTFKGEALSNSGLTILRFRDNKICEHWEYTDTEYLAHMFRGWRKLVEPEVGAVLTNWAPPDSTRAVDSGDHT